MYKVGRKKKKFEVSSEDEMSSVFSGLPPRSRIAEDAAKRKTFPFPLINNVFFSIRASDALFTKG